MTVTFTKWQAEQLKAMVADKIFDRMGTAAKLVEDDARRRLNAIKKPDTKRDVNYRNYLSQYILTHTVGVEGNAIVGRIGMRIGKQGQKHHGFYIERGSSTAPAQPYLRPALVQNIKNILGILTK